LIVHTPQFFTSLTLPLKPKQNWKNAKDQDLLKPLLKTDFAKNEPCQKKTSLTKCLGRLDNQSLNQTC
jgi:hypothetical protein